jgi:hypothetical protein
LLHLTGPLSFSRRLLRSISTAQNCAGATISPRTVRRRLGRRSAEGTAVLSWQRGSGQTWEIGHGSNRSPFIRLALTKGRANDTGLRAVCPDQKRNPRSCPGVCRLPATGFCRVARMPHCLTLLARGWTNNGTCQRLTALSRLFLCPAGPRDSGGRSKKGGTASPAVPPTTHAGQAATSRSRLALYLPAASWSSSDKKGEKRGARSYFRC